MRKATPSSIWWCAAWAGRKPVWTMRTSGTYYSKALVEAKSRIDFVPLDPLMQVRAYFDIGGTDARADAVAIWICQFVGQKINVLEYYQAEGQELSVHLAWMRSRGWGKAWVPAA